MKTGSKVILGAGLIATLSGIIYALTRGEQTQAAPPPAGGLTITLYDQYGNIIGTIGGPATNPAMLAVTATEGDTITGVLSVTNASYQMLGGVKTPVAAQLTIRFSGAAPNAALSPASQVTLSFAPGETKNIGYATLPGLRFSLPIGSGTPGSVAASVLDPSGNTLTTASATFAIASAPIVYGGTISIG